MEYSCQYAFYIIIKPTSYTLNHNPIDKTCFTFLLFHKVKRKIIDEFYSYLSKVRLSIFCSVPFFTGTGEDNYFYTIFKTFSTNLICTHILTIQHTAVYTVCTCQLSLTTTVYCSLYCLYLPTFITNNTLSHS